VKFKQISFFFFFFFNFLTFFCLFGLVFRDRVPLCSPGCPGTHSVDQAGLELRNPPVSASQVLGLKACEWLQLLSLCSCSLRSSVSVGFIVYCLQSKRSPEWTASQWLGQAMAAVQVLQPILDGRRRDGSACVASEDGSLWVEGVR
jgi:hypothetical protein